MGSLPHKILKIKYNTVLSNLFLHFLGPNFLDVLTVCGKCKLLNYQTLSRTASFTPPTRWILDLRSKLFNLKSFITRLVVFPQLLFNLSRWKQLALTLNYSWWIFELEPVKSMFLTFSKPKVKADEVGYSGFRGIPPTLSVKQHFTILNLKEEKYFSFFDIPKLWFI